MLTNTRNITRTFRQTSKTDRTNGRDWYANAHALATELDPNDPVAAAAVIAVLSPQTVWERNITLARLAYARRDLPLDEFLQGWPGMHTAATKAYRILSGEAPESVVSGPKVTAFWRTIVDPTDPTLVVVDRHAFAVAAGHVVDDKTRDYFLHRKGNYELVADQYRHAATILSRETGQAWSPAQIQSATWEFQRRNHSYESR